MHLERYNFNPIPNKNYNYEFFSEGPNGRIKKIARFILVISHGVPFYNLAFGDWDDQENAINDIAVTNNGDTEKVLATIASIIVHFTNQFPNALIYVEGSTPARTRRYQMGMNKLWEEINEIFEVFGLKSDDTIERFQKNVNYIGFYGRRI